MTLNHKPPERNTNCLGSILSKNLFFIPLYFKPPPPQLPTSLLVHLTSAFTKGQQRGGILNWGLPIIPGFLFRWYDWHAFRPEVWPATPLANSSTVVFLVAKQKNPAYGRHWISRPIWMVAPIPYIYIYLYIFFLVQIFFGGFPNIFLFGGAGDPFFQSKKN